MCRRKRSCNPACCRKSAADTPAPRSPIDGWPGWVIVAAVSCSLFIMMGIGKSLGLLLDELIDYFHVPMFRVTMVFGMSAIAYTLSAPVAIVLGEILSPRIVIMIGAFLAFLGMSLSAFMFSIDFIGATFGVFFGIGNGFLYGNALVTIVQYFDKWRSLANGIALAGASIGNFAFPPLIQYFLDEYTLKGTLLLMGGLYFEIVLCGALMRPVSYYKRQFSSHTGRSLNTDCDDVMNVDERSERASSHGNQSEQCEHKKVSSTHTELSNIELDDMDEVKMSADSQLLSDRGDCEEANSSSAFIQKVDARIESCMLESEEKHELLTHTGDNDVRTTQTPPPHVLTSDFGGGDNILNTSVHSLSKHDTVKHSRKFLSCLCSSKECRNSWKEAFKKMFDFSVLKNRLCLLFLFFNLFAFFGFFNFVLFLPLLGTAHGSYNRALLISICGIADLFGRLGIGAFSDLNLIDRYKLMIIAHIIIGVDLLVFVSASTYTQLAIQSAIYGLAGGGYVTLLPVVVVDFVGLEMMPKALAVVLLFQGTAGAVGQVLLGWLVDVTGSYDAVLYLLGTCCLTAAVILMFYPLVQKLEQKRCSSIPGASARKREVEVPS